MEETFKKTNWLYLILNGISVIINYILSVM